MLECMGYNKNASIRALIACKNDIEGAINWIMDNMDKNIEAPITQENKKQSQESGTVGPKFDLSSVLQIQEMGFEDYQAKIALIKNVKYLFS